MRYEKKKDNSYLEISCWDSWYEMLFGLELRRSKSVEKHITYTFGLTVLYRVLFFIEYTTWKSN